MSNKKKFERALKKIEGLQLDLKQRNLAIASRDEVIAELTAHLDELYTALDLESDDIVVSEESDNG